ncbi:hypothetical protein C2845_PM01G33990 [Panicum miliaceum]|uniref:Protein kinase domain-containing protein n=1 Tax=Panicum miliaceum TaxID=4540 RepID=A0A3L6TV26_PANMI|nr:hypothetical protein C2845_PM01G33990 [Panicum miliaceum]
MVPKVLRAVAIACATVLIVILLVVYVGCKLYNRSRPLPLAPAGESEAAVEVEPTSSNVSLGDKPPPPPSPWEPLATTDLWVTPHDVILNATDNLSDAHVIGHGGFGTVYGGELPDGRRVAFKRLRPSRSYRFVCKSHFVAEMQSIVKCTAKGDVYGFGVVVLEVLTGRPPAGQEVEEGGGDLVGWVRWMVAHGREGELFDPCLPASGLGREQMARVLAVARECTADEPWKRPTVGSVVKDLETVQLMEHGGPHGHGLQGREPVFPGDQPAKEMSLEHATASLWLFFSFTASSEPDTVIRQDMRMEGSPFIHVLGQRE